MGWFSGCCQVLGSAQRRGLREVWIPSWNGGHMGDKGGLLGTRPLQMKGPVWALWLLPQWDGSLLSMWEECPAPSEIGWSPWCIGL